VPCLTPRRGIREKQAPAAFNEKPRRAARWRIALASQGGHRYTTRLNP
jgi:hypothetical protein